MSFSGLRILGFPSNQFAGQMPEGDGEEMVCHLKEKNADFGDIFAKVRKCSIFCVCSDIKSVDVSSIEDEK